MTTVHRQAAVLPATSIPQGPVHTRTKNPAASGPATGAGAGMSMAMGRVVLATAALTAALMAAPLQAQTSAPINSTTPATALQEGGGETPGTSGLPAGSGMQNGNETPAASNGSGAPAGSETEDPHAEAVMHTARFRALAHELRCLVCQNQTLLDSHADLAKDLRLEVVRLIDRGLDDRQIKDYLVDRYGEFVLYRPTWSWQNSILWAGPAVMLLAAGAGIWRLTRRRRLTADEGDEVDDTGDTLDEASASDDVDDDEPAPLSAEEALRRVDAQLAATDSGDRERPPR